ncbi:hypothetical protein ACFX1Q_040311 [Malus domestica]
MPTSIKICTRRRFKCALEIEEAPAQKSKRRLLSQKLGYSETTRTDLRNRRGVCFLKSWAAQRPRRSISKIEEALTFSKAGLLRDHEGRSQKSKRRLLSQKLGCSETTRADLRNRRGTCFFCLVSTCHMHT